MKPDSRLCSVEGAQKYQARADHAFVLQRCGGSTPQTTSHILHTLPRTGSSNLIALVVYLTSGACGYIAFGNDVLGNVLLNYHHGDRILVIGRVLVVISFVVSIPLQVHPCINNQGLMGIPGR
jgi:hypothetical protein